MYQFFSNFLDYVGVVHAFPVVLKDALDPQDGLLFLVRQEVVEPANAHVTLSLSYLKVMSYSI